MRASFGGSRAKPLPCDRVARAQTYTWDKQIESWVKSSGLMGGKGKDPTVITPVQYKNRFRAAMVAHWFLEVPDRHSQLPGAVAAAVVPGVGDHGDGEVV